MIVRFAEAQYVGDSSKRSKSHPMQPFGLGDLRRRHIIDVSQYPSTCHACGIKCSLNLVIAYWSVIPEI